MGGPGFMVGAPLRRCRLTGMLLVAVLALMVAPVGAHAAQQVITSSGPLSQIFINDDLACQVQTAADPSPSFFGGTNPGHCGTFLAVGSTLFGPSVGPPSPTPFAPMGTQTQTGTGTATDPFVVTTVGNAGTVAQITEKDSYVVGQSSYDTVITVIANSPSTLYHAGDCFLGSLDNGFGAFDTSAGNPGSPQCTINPNNTPPARFMSFTPVSPAANYIEGLYTTVWSAINSTATPFPNTVDATVNQDNGMGLSWPISPGPSPTVVHLTTTVSPFTLASSSSAGPCVANGQFPVTVAAANGGPQLNYILDGGARQSTPADAAGHATIAVPAGKHTVEYWGGDQAGNQESPHHVQTVTVEPGGPSVAITSDQSAASYEVGDPASITVTANGVGLTSNPSAAHVPISTANPGRFTVQRSATDPCGTATANFTYRVLAPPALGKNVNVEPVTGVVFVKLPHGASLSATPRAASANAAVSKGVGFVPLTDARQIPVGSVLDATGGAVRLTTATAASGKLQAADFSAGIFNVLQKRQQRGLTTLNLTDAHSARQACARKGKKARAAARRLSSKVLGLLNGNGHGRFTTRGRYSAATVRGTIWTVTDRCDGTLTRVTRGVVVIRDFRQRRNVTVRAGKSYLAKAPGA